MSSAAPSLSGAPQPPAPRRTEGRSATSIARSIARSTFVRASALIISLNLVLVLALGISFAYACHDQLPATIRDIPLIGWSAKGSAFFLIEARPAQNAADKKTATSENTTGLAATNQNTTGQDRTSENTTGLAATNQNTTGQDRTSENTTGLTDAPATGRSASSAEDVPDEQELSLVYVVRGSDGSVWEFPVDQALGYATPALCVLAAFEFFALLGAATSTRRIRRRLRPLNELALTAEAVGSATDAGYTWTGQAGGASKIDKLGNLERAISSADVASPLVETGDDDLRSIEVALNGLLRRMQNAQREQLRFVDDASHELRTPIAVIQGYVDLLDRWGKSDPEVLDESIGALKEETAHMKELVEQLLFLARGDSGRTALVRVPINLAALAAEVVEESRMIDAAHPYELGSAAAAPGATEDSRYTMVGDAALVKQCVRIIVQNAAKYSDSASPIRLNVGSAAGQASLSVSDAGTGIDASELPRTFDRFWRSDQARSSQTGGSGLGLSIARWIMDAHDGRIDVTSAPGIGTRFTLVFPAREDSDAPITGAQVAGARAAGAQNVSARAAGTRDAGGWLTGAQVATASASTPATDGRPVGANTSARATDGQQTAPNKKASSGAAGATSLHKRVARVFRRRSTRS